MDSESQSQPPRKYLEALLKGLEGNQTQPEQAGTASVQDPKLREFLSKLEKENPLPKPESLEQLSREFDADTFELSKIESKIQELRNAIEKLKAPRNALRKKTRISCLLLNISSNLEKNEQIDGELMRLLHDFLIGNAHISQDIDMTLYGYKESIHIYVMIFSKSHHQENKDHACLQLALHELRMKNIKQADLFALSILDDTIKHQYDIIKKTHHY